MIIGYCILIHPGICILWCRTTMRSVRLVSYAFLYTTHIITVEKPISVQVQSESSNSSLLYRMHSRCALCSLSSTTDPAFCISWKRESLFRPDVPLFYHIENT